MPFYRQNLGAAGTSMILDVRGMENIGVGLAGTFSGTLNLEASQNGGQTWDTYKVVSEPYNETGTFVTSFTTTGSYVGRNSGVSHVRLTMSNYASGTAKATLSAAKDGSYADGFLTENQIQRKVIGTAGDNASLVITPNAYHRTKVSEVILSWNIMTATGTTLLVIDLTTPATLGQMHVNPVASPNNISFGPVLSQTRLPMDFVAPPNSTLELRLGSIALVTSAVNAKCTLV